MWFECDSYVFAEWNGVWTGVVVPGGHTLGRSEIYGYKEYLENRSWRMVL